ncbi:hypothetical protein [Campylobacter jejuni]|uniref:hypothetical protein n=1 Tax=Campylobacter jejuni TaxID=197 RepID=UPI000576E636|nr:hypothetical protein [Campylobacter jejuni]
MSTENKIDLIIARLRSYDLIISDNGAKGSAYTYGVTGSLKDKNIKVVINHYITTGTITIQGSEEQFIRNLVGDIL